MAIVMSELNFAFPEVVGSRQQQTKSINFGGVVRAVKVLLAGFEVHYGNGDHHVLREQVQLAIVGNSGGVVNILASLLLRDGSGNIDDQYGGSIDAVVIADVV